MNNIDISDSSTNTVKASGVIKTETEEPQDDSENQLPRRSDRISIPTDKMAQYKAEEIEKREKNLFNAFDMWRSKIREIRNTLKVIISEQTFTELVDNVKSHEDIVIKHFQDLRSIGTVSQETVRKVDACSAVSGDVMRIINERLCEIDAFNPDQEATRLRRIKYTEYAKSIFSKSDSESRHSMHSTHSRNSERMVEASAENAAKQA